MLISNIDIKFMTKYKCRYCDVPFNTRQSESKHRSKNCKLNPKHKDFVKKESINIQETFVAPNPIIKKTQEKCDVIHKSEISSNKTIEIEKLASNIIHKQKVFLKKTFIPAENIVSGYCSSEFYEHDSAVVIDGTNGNPLSVKTKHSLLEKPNEKSSLLSNNEDKCEIIEFMKTMYADQQKSIIELQRRHDESISSLKKELQEIKEKPTIQNIDNSVNSINFNLDIYFTSKLDLHHLACLQKGEAWANDYFLYAIHRDGKYLDSITNFVVSANVDKSPIRMGKDGQIEFYRSSEVIDYDHDGHTLERESKDLTKRAYLKVFNNSGIGKQLDLLDQNSLRIAEMENRASNPEESRNNINKSFIDEKSYCIQDKILNGGDGLPPLKDLHKNLDKINRYKISAADRKHFTKLLPASMQS